MSPQCSARNCTAARWPLSQLRRSAWLFFARASSREPPVFRKGLHHNQVAPPAVPSQSVVVIRTCILRSESPVFRQGLHNRQVAICATHPQCVVVTRTRILCSERPVFRKELHNRQVAISRS
mmetsp:Transcript_25970/g.65262  ORF Transcript_25970/g.65262 Transcript_25970/m.65262 type:complete len:122 (-) Transcript_25970:79-444(-)